MIRELNSSEATVLTELATKIGQIATAGGLNRLTRTGVLGSQASPQDYADFHDRFGRLPTRLRDLIIANLIKVNTELDPVMGANTPTGVDNGNPVVSIELPPQMLEADAATLRTERAIELVHELSHTIFEAPDFPIRDYTYRGSWGQGYLSGQLSWRNADTYAEAAAQVAEDLDGAPGRYRTKRKVVARRELLRSRQALALGPALAWAEIKVNRAWLRSDDYRSFAREWVGSLKWNEVLAAWRQDPNRSALLAIEDDLRARNRIIGDRYGNIRIGLSAESQKTAENIYRYMTRLKGALGGLTLRLSGGGVLGYDDQTKVLTVPRDQVAVSPLALGERVVDALVAALTYNDATDRSTLHLNTHKRAIVELLVDNDRPLERRELQPLRADFRGAQPGAAPTPAEWAALEVELDLAGVEATAEGMAHTAGRAAGAAGTARQGDLESLDQALRPDVDAAVEIGQRLAGKLLSDDQARRRKTHFTGMHVQLTRINDAVRPLYPNKEQAYDDLAQSLTPFMQ